jgi:Kef-type K+ transport system membrane component KefB
MHAHDAVVLLVFALGAFSIPILFNRLGLPAAVGEILYGLAVGPQALALVRDEPFTAALAELGFAVLMFLAGLELDFSRIEKEGARRLGAAALAVGVLNGVAFALALALGYPPFLGIAFAAVSVGILLVTLAEGGHTRSGLGQTIILTGSLGEFASILLLTGFSFYHRHGVGGRLATELAKLGALLVAAYLVMLVLRTLIWWWPGRFARVVRTHDPSEIGVRSGMALMLVFVALATLLGVESILGAFVAGALFAAVFRDKGILETKMASLGHGFFVPVFFIWVGTQFDLRAVARADVLVAVVGFAACSVIAKLAGASVLALRGLGPREVVSAALLLASPLTLLVVVGRIGVEVKALDPGTASGLVLLAMISSVVFPTAFRLLVPAQDAPGPPDARTRRRLEGGQDVL